jgi:hypothetical protein
MSSIKGSITAKLGLILLIYALIGVTLCSANLQVTVNRGQVILVQFPERGVIANTDGTGTITRISLTSLPITGIVDGTGNILQASGPGTVYYNSDGKVSQIGDVYLYYNSDGKISQIGDLYLYYNSGGMVSQIGDLYLYYNSGGMVSQIGDVYLYYNSNGKVSQIGDVYFYYNSDGMVSQIGDVYVYYYNDGSFKETSGSDPRIQVIAS